MQCKSSPTQMCPQQLLRIIPPHPPRYRRCCCVNGATGLANDIIWEVTDPPHVELLLRIERSQLRWFSHMTRMQQETSCRPHPPQESGPEVAPRTRWSDYISDLAWFHLGVEPAELSEILVDRDVLRVLLGLLSPRPSPEETLT